MRLHYVRYAEGVCMSVLQIGYCGDDSSGYKPD